MGSLLQLMTLPAACMAFLWARRYGATAVANVLCGMVAMIAMRDTARARVVRAAARNGTKKAGKGVRAATAKMMRSAGRGRVPRRAWKGTESVGFA